MPITRALAAAAGTQPQLWNSARTLPCRGASTTFSARKTAAQASICAGTNEFQIEIVSAQNGEDGAEANSDPPPPYFEIRSLKIIDHKVTVEVDAGSHEGGTCDYI